MNKHVKTTQYKMKSPFNKFFVVVHFHLDQVFRCLSDYTSVDRENSEFLHLETRRKGSDAGGKKGRVEVKSGDPFTSSLVNMFPPRKTQRTPILQLRQCIGDPSSLEGSSPVSTTGRRCNIVTLLDRFLKNLKDTVQTKTPPRPPHFCTLASVECR